MGRITVKVYPRGLPAAELRVPAEANPRLTVRTANLERVNLEVLADARLTLRALSLARINVPTDLPPDQPPTPGDFILLESGDYLLLESGDRIPLES